MRRFMLCVLLLHEITKLGNCQLNIAMHICVGSHGQERVMPLE